MIELKRKTVLLPIILIALCFLAAFKGGSGFTVEVDNSYAVATKASEVDTVAQRLQMDEATVAQYFKNNALKFIAVSKDTKTQIRISRFQDDFSSDVYDAQNLTDEQIGEMVSLYGAEEENVTVINNSERKYAKIVDVLKDSGGVYTSTQYITVAGGRTYIITAYNPGEATSKEVEKIFSTFSVRDMTERLRSYETQKKWILPFVVIMCVIVAISVIGICKKLYEK